MSNIRITENQIKEDPNIIGKVLQEVIDDLVKESVESIRVYFEEIKTLLSRTLPNLSDDKINEMAREILKNKL